MHGKGRASPVLSEELVAQHVGEGIVLSPSGDGSLQVPGCAGGLCALGTLSLCWVMQLQAQPLTSKRAWDSKNSNPSSPEANCCG